MKASIRKREETTMKLNLLFIVMDLLTVLAFPIVFVHGKLRQFSKSKESILWRIYSLLFQSRQANDNWKL